MHFIPFLSLRRTVWRPHMLSHINALCIDLLYLPKGQSLKFFEKIFRIEGAGKQLKDKGTRNIVATYQGFQMMYCLYQKSEFFLRNFIQELLLSIIVHHILLSVDCGKLKVFKIIVIYKYSMIWWFNNQH